MADIDKLNIDSIIQRLLEGEGRGRRGWEGGAAGPMRRVPPARRGLKGHQNGGARGALSAWGRRRRLPAWLGPAAPTFPSARAFPRRFCLLIPRCNAETSRLPPSPPEQL